MFLRYKKAKPKSVLTGSAVAMVTNFAMKITNIVASCDKQRQYSSVKVLLLVKK